MLRLIATRFSLWLLGFCCCHHFRWTAKQQDTSLPDQRLQSVRLSGLPSCFTEQAVFSRLRMLSVMPEGRHYSLFSVFNAAICNFSPSHISFPLSRREDHTSGITCQPCPSAQPRRAPSWELRWVWLVCWLCWNKRGDFDDHSMRGGHHGYSPTHILGSPPTGPHHTCFYPTPTCKAPAVLLSLTCLCSQLKCWMAQGHTPVRPMLISWL